MQNSKILFISLSVLLAGCSDFFNDDGGSFSAGSASPPAPVAVPPAPPGPPAPQPPPAPPPGPHHSDGPYDSKPSDCGCDGKPGSKPIPSAALKPNPGTSPFSETDWVPTEEERVIAADIVRELENKNSGTTPSRTVIKSSIQSRMGLSDYQTNILLEEIGQ